MCYEELKADGVLSIDGELLVDPRQLEHGIGPLEHMVHGGAMVPYGVSDDIVKIMTEDELKRAQLLWLAEPLNVAWNMHEILPRGLRGVELLPQAWVVRLVYGSTSICQPIAQDDGLHECWSTKGPGEGCFPPHPSAFFASSRVKKKVLVARGTEAT